MKKIPIHKRLQSQIILVCSLVILIASCIVGIFSLSQYRKLLEENTRKHASDLAAAIESAIETRISEFDEFSRNAYLSNQIHMILDESSSPELRQKDFQAYCNSSVGYKRYLNDLYLICNDGTVLTNKGFASHLKEKLISCGWYNDLLTAEGGIVVDYGKSWLSDIYFGHENVITVGRLMKSLNVEDTNTYYTPTGAIIFEVSPSFVKSLLSSHDLYGTELIMTDENDQIIYDSTGKNGGKSLQVCHPGIENDDEYELQDSSKASMFVQRKTLKYGWNLYLLFDLSEVAARESLFRRYLFVLAFSILIINLLLSFLFSRNIIRPIQKIRDNMKKIEDGHLEERLTGDFPYELEGIAYSYNRMLDSLQEQINENYVMKLETIDSKYKALEAQVNPHFIFNVLDMINSEMILSGNPAGAKTIRSLARLIRYNLDNSQDLVTLDEDRKHIENYCSLLQEVYPVFQSVTIDFGAELGELKIPSHCIQPLVENAVKHGFTGIDHPGILEMKAGIDDDRLCISVRDNGNGISESDLQELQKRLETSDSSAISGHSIGLVNIQRRLRLKYGPEYGIMIESKENDFTQVTLTVPLHTV